MEKELKVRTLDELAMFAQRIVDEYLPHADGEFCIALHGDLGAGKTAFVKALAKVLGVTEEVTSPTFVIMRSYDIEHEQFDRLVHIDAYRIESPDELDPLRFAEVAGDPRALLCIEWPEQLGDRLPSDALHLTFTIEPDETRSIVVGGPVVS